MDVNLNIKVNKNVSRFTPPLQFLAYTRKTIYVYLADLPVDHNTPSTPT